MSSAPILDQRTDRILNGPLPLEVLRFGAPLALGMGLQTAFNLRIPVTIAAPGALPRFEMKAKRWVRN